MVGLVVSGQWSVVSFLEDYRGELGRRMRERGIGHYVNFGRGGLGRKKRKMLPLKKNIRIFADSFYKEYIIMYVRQRPCTWARREHWQEVTNSPIFQL